MNRSWLYISFLAVILCRTSNAEKKCIFKDLASLSNPLRGLEGVWYQVVHKRHETAADFEVAKIESTDEEGKLLLTTYAARTNDSGVVWCPDPTVIHLRADDNNIITATVVENEGTADVGLKLKLIMRHNSSRSADDAMVVLYTCLGQTGSPGGEGKICPEDQQFLSVYARSPVPHLVALRNVVRTLHDVCFDTSTLLSLVPTDACIRDIIPQRHISLLADYRPAPEPASEVEPVSEAESEPELPSEAEPEPKPATEAEPEPSRNDHCKVANIMAAVIEDNDSTRAQLPSFSVYLLASYDPLLVDMRASYMKSTYYGSDGDKMQFTYEMIINRVCYKGEMYTLKQEDAGNKQKYTVNNPYTDVEGNRDVFKRDWANLHEDADFTVAYGCDTENEFGFCDQPRLVVTSRQRRLDRRTWIRVHRVVERTCVPFFDLVHMATDVECKNPRDLTPKDESSSSEENSNEMSESAEKSPPSCNSNADIPVVTIKPDEVNGTWYVAAYRLSSPVFSTIKTLGPLQLGQRDDDGIRKMNFFVRFVSGDVCDGPFTGMMQLMDNSRNRVGVTVEFSEASASGNRSSHSVEAILQVIHVDHRMLVLYQCSERSAVDNYCLQHEALLLSRSRALRRPQLDDAMQRLHSVCVEEEQLVWNPLLDSCGSELDGPLVADADKGRLMLVQKDIRDIMVRHTQPRCSVADIKGQFVCMKKFAKSGPWFIIGYAGAKTQQSGGAVLKFSYEGNMAGVGRVFIGTPHGCTTYKVVLSAHKVNDRDTWYTYTADGAGVHTRKVLRFIWSNYRLAVAYLCHDVEADGTCDPDLQEVIIFSTTAAVDYAEYKMLELVVASVCVDPAEISFLSPHDHCVREALANGNELYRVKQDCDYENVGAGGFHMTDMGNTVFHDVAMAAKDLRGLQAAVYRVADDGNEDGFALSDGKCEEFSVTQSMCNTTGAVVGEFSLKTSEGVTSKYSWWPVLEDTGVYSLTLGCSAEPSECTFDNGFAFIHSTDRRYDPISLHNAYAWLAENCIDPKWFTKFDLQSECGAELDERTCKVADVQSKGISEYNPEKHNGLWYMTATLFDTHESMVCEVKQQEGGENFEKHISCYTQTNGKCHGPGNYTMTVDFDDGTFWINRFEDNEHLPFPDEGTILYQDDNHLLCYGCRKQNEDGSCMIDEEWVTLSSKKQDIQTDVIPQGVIDKLHQVCVDVSRLAYKQKTDCGANLNS